LTVKELQLWAAQVTNSSPIERAKQHTAAVVAAVDFICKLGEEQGEDGKLGVWKGHAAA
jgi:hypothetical protein